MINEPRERRERGPKDMPRDEITVRLNKRTDESDNLFLFGTPDLPAMVDLSKCFLIVFTGDRPCLVIRQKAASKREGKEIPLED
jgi:hypothetical protein